jgi:hypothetical protein
MADARLVGGLSIDVEVDHVQKPRRPLSETGFISNSDNCETCRITPRLKRLGVIPSHDVSQVIVLFGTGARRAAVASSDDVSKRLRAESRTRAEATISSCSAH